ncbi:MAG: hypothetical protein FWE47_04730 [Oscillospiraceae bacterium]|nr:hypothetical protein [Oscillospiraceae bacterium]
MIRMNEFLRSEAVTDRPYNRGESLAVNRRGDVSSPVLRRDYPSTVGDDAHIVPHFKVFTSEK